MMATKTAKYNPPLTAAKKRYIFPRKPAKGGTPAIEKNMKAIVIASNGFVFEIVRNCKIPFKFPNEFWLPNANCRGM